MTENRVIGKNNALPWQLPDEMAYFRKVTYGHPVVMGRKTFESRGCKPLPGRLNIVVTSHPDKCENVVTASNLVEAIDKARATTAVRELMVIGGANIYREGLEVADRLHCTVVHAKLDGDVYFPEIDFNKWLLRSRQTHSVDERHQYGFTMYVFDRPES